MEQLANERRLAAEVAVEQLLERLAVRKQERKLFVVGRSLANKDGENLDYFVFAVKIPEVVRKI